MSKLDKAPFTNLTFAISVITNAPDLESAMGISQHRADTLSAEVMERLDDHVNPTTAELILASTKVVSTVEELVWIMFKVGTYAEMQTGAGKKILRDFGRDNSSSTDIN